MPTMSAQGFDQQRQDAMKGYAEIVTPFLSAPADLVSSGFASPEEAHGEGRDNHDSYQYRIPKDIEAAGILVSAPAVHPLSAQDQYQAWVRSNLQARDPLIFKLSTF